MLKNLITVQEATARYGLSGVYIRLLAREGRIRGRKMGTTWVIDPSSLEQYMKSARKRGRPSLTNTVRRDRF